MSLTPTALSAVALVALALGLLGLVLGVVAYRRHQLVERRYAVLWGDGEADVAAVLAQQSRRIGAERARVDAVEAAVAGLQGTLAQSLQHVAVVRYDAFGDMGGRMSFSAAVVDDNGDGMVLSSIHARGESRTYAKGIVGGKSDTTLTPEEQQALAAARDDAGGGTSRGSAAGTELDPGPSGGAGDAGRAGEGGRIQTGGATAAGGRRPAVTIEDDPED